MALSSAFQTMEELLADQYKNQEWEKKRGDFALVEKLAKKDSAIWNLSRSICFDPVYETLKSPAQESGPGVRYYYSFCQWY